MMIKMNLKFCFRLTTELANSIDELCALMACKNSLDLARLTDSFKKYFTPKFYLWNVETEGALPEPPAQPEAQPQPRRLDSKSFLLKSDRDNTNNRKVTRRRRNSI